MNNKRTTHVRIYRGLRDELKFKFPEVRMQDLIQTAWDTSALKLEAKLRKKK